MNKDHKIRVFICEDHRAFTDGLEKWFLDSAFQVMGRANTAVRCLEMTASKPLDIILLDIRMGNDKMAGIKLAEKLIERFKGNDSDPHIVFLSGYNDQVYFDKAHEMGCSFLNKDLRVPDIMNHLETIYTYKRIIVDINDVIPDPIEIANKHRNILQEQLSPKQGLTACMLAELGDNGKVAEALGSPLTTINTHLRDIYGKLGLKGQKDNRITLIKMVVRSGLLQHIDSIKIEPKNWFGRDKIIR